MTAWVIRAGAFGETEEWNLEEGRAGAAFNEVGDLSGCASREEVRNLVTTAYPDAGSRTQANFAGQLWALRREVAPGDLIVMPLKSKRGYIAIGKCTAAYSYDSYQAALDRRHHVCVDWAPDLVSKSSLKDDLVNTLNGAMTVFRAARNKAEQRLQLVFHGAEDPGVAGVHTPTSPQRQVELDTEEADVIDPPAKPSVEALRDHVRNYLVENFSGHKLTALVAEILTALGFVCDVSPEGPDGGVDIMCGRGPLGLDAPTVVVEVKSQPTPVGTDVVRSLHSAVNRLNAHQGLLVAMGGINGPAGKELSTQRTTIRVWDAESVLDNLFKTYPTLTSSMRQRVPLVQAWVLEDQEG